MKTLSHECTAPGKPFLSLPSHPSVCSGVLDQGPGHAETQSRCRPLLPHSLPVVLGLRQQLLPAGHLHDVGADRWAKSVGLRVSRKRDKRHLVATVTMVDSLFSSVRSEVIPSPPTYNTKYGYLSWESYSNLSYYTRLLPPVPDDCPVPMGTKGSDRGGVHRQPAAWEMARTPHLQLVFLPSAGKSVLPDPKVLTERFFKREKFRPDPQGTNVMFSFMAQHFTHQFFKTNHETKGGFTKAVGHGVSCTRT